MLGVCDGQVTVLMQGNMQGVRRDLYHPGVCDDHPRARGTGSKLIDAAKLCVDGRGDGPPAGAR